MRINERIRFNRSGKIILTTLLGLIFIVSNTFAQTGEQKNKASHISFADVPLKAAIKMLGKQIKMNIVFDDSFRDQPKYELELEAVTVASALKIIFIQNKLSARLLEDNTIFVYFDNPTNQARFGGYPEWSAKPPK